MQRKKTIVTRESVEDVIRDTLNHPIRPTYDWMYDLGLSSTQREVYAYIFDICKQDCVKEFYINTYEMSKKIGITIAQCNNITRVLTKAGLIYKRTESKRSYYSLYPNPLTV